MIPSSRTASDAALAALSRQLRDDMPAVLTTPIAGDPADAEDPFAAFQPREWCRVSALVRCFRGHSSFAKGCRDCTAPHPPRMVPNGIGCAGALEETAFLLERQVEGDGPDPDTVPEGFWEPPPSMFGRALAAAA